MTVSDCPAGTGEQDAGLLRDPPGAEIAAHAFLATFDGGGNTAVDINGPRSDLPSRIPANLCLSSRIRIGQSSVPILRSPHGPTLSVDCRTRAVALMSDSGMCLEGYLDDGNGLGAARVRNAPSGAYCAVTVELWMTFRHD